MSPQSRRLLAVGLVAFICSTLGLGTSSIAAQSSVNLAVTEIAVVQQVDPSDGQTHDFVNLKGSVTHSGTDGFSEKIQLVTGRPITTRSELSDLIKRHNTSGLFVAPVDSVAVSQLANGQNQNWSFSVRADTLWGTSSSGVFPLGVSNENSSAVDIVAVPWFGNTEQLSATRVTTAVVVTSNKHVSDEADAASIVSSEVSRLSALTSGLLEDQSFIVDNYALDILSLSDTQQAQDTATRIRQRQSVPSIYGNTNLARLNAGNQQAAIKRALALTPNSGTVLYLPRSATPSLESFGARLDSVVVPVVTNTLVAGDKNATVDARASVATQRVLVADQSLSDCLTFAVPFDAQWCVSAQLGMITAESPNVSRNVLLVTPPTWSPSPEMLVAINNALRSRQGYTNESLLSLMRSDPVTSIAITSTPAKPFDSSIRKVEREVLRAQASVENVFGDTEMSTSLASSAAVVYSHNWKSAASAKHFGRTHVQQAHEFLGQLRLEGSKHITIPGTEADLPITVFNSSAFTAHVQVLLNGTGANRITTHASDLITVEPGRRVTVQIPITLNSAGDVQAVAYLADSTGATFGDSLSIQIASTAYQQFARSLVWVALIALILLVGNNVWRRTRSTHSEDKA